MSKTDSSEEPADGGDLPESLTTVAAARRLGVTVPTVQRWLDQGVLRGWKTHGGHRRIELASIDRYIKRQLGVLNPAPRVQLDVLIVEDSPIERELLQLAVSSVDPEFQIRQACDGFEALTEVARRVPFIVITDIRMPHMNGIEMVRHLLTGYPGLRGRIIVISYGDGGELKYLGESAADTAFVQKPIDPNRLRIQIESMKAAAGY